MRWIDAKFLDEQWSSTLTSESLLPELVRDLIYASVDDPTKIKEIRFPITDLARTPGYDGQTNMVGLSNTYVPDGKTVWELKTSKDFEKNANTDFKKRSKDTKGIDKNNTTYIFATSKAWKNGQTSKEEWIIEKKEEDPNWKDIKIIDAIDLENWLELCPGVGANFAKKMGKSPLNGAQGTEEFWDSYINRYGPPINEEVILTSRQSQAKELISKLLTERSLTKMHADSVDEVIAFVIGAINSSDEETRDRLKAKTLILHSEDAVNFFSNQTGMIFIISPHIQQSCGFLSTKNTLIIPAGRKGPNNDFLKLIRPTVYELSESLKKIGYQEEDAARAAKECGGSITILSRRRPSVGFQQPGWIVKHGKNIIPAMLAGGWDENNDHDPNIVSSLAAKDKYEDYQEEILPILTLEEGPIEREGAIWKMIAPVDAFVALGNQISANDYDRLQKVSTEVFNEIDPNIEDPSEDEPFNEFSRKPYKYSSWLRDGLATTLLQIAALHEELGLHIPKSTPQKFVNDLVSNLPGLKNDPRVIMSLKRELPLLMEAAPAPFLEALEHMLEGDKNVLKKMFDEKDSFLFPTSSHHNLLWGLEGMAWDPSLLKRVSLILAKLAKIDPGGKTINRPINSLREIFLLWHPGTNANIQQRFLALDGLINEEPEIAWNLIELILPEFHSTSHNTHKPMYREAGASNREVLTWGIIWKSNFELLSRSTKLAGSNPNRWKSILETLSQLKPDLRSVVLEEFIKATQSMNKKQKILCWNILRDYINKNRSFPDADWVLPKEDLDGLDAFLPTLEPADFLNKYKWLFDDYHPDLADSKHDLDLSEARLKETRLNAISSIYDAQGIEGIINLAEVVTESQILASTFSDAEYSLDIYKEAIQKAHGKNEKLSHFCFALSSSLQHKYSDWIALFLDLIHTNAWSDSLKAQLILAWPDNNETWAIAALLGKGVEEIYWKEKRAWGGRNLSLSDMEQYVRKLLDNQRAMASIEVICDNAKNIKAEIIYEILDKAIPEINELQGSNNTMLGYYIEKVFESLSARDDVNENTLAAYEYKYLNVLEKKSNTLAIHKLLAKDPKFYISVICDVFKPKNSEGLPATDENRLKAQAGYRLLNSFKKIPGHSDTVFDINALRSWSQEVLKLAQKEDRLEITQQQIGALFAHAPNDPEDNAWPHKNIRELIEELSSEEVEKGISIERFNMRGVHTRNLYEGGQQERDLAAQNHEWADQCKDWPRTHDLLTEIAQEWEYNANFEDKRANLDRMKGGF